MQIPSLIGRALCLFALACATASAPSRALATDAGPTPCRLRGIEHQALCGTVERPLDPARPQATQIAVHYAVLPALARNKQPDPVFFFAGGPGQSAIEIAPAVSAMLSRFANRRDIVLIDQRGTGRSAPLHCDADDPALPLARVVQPRAPARAACRLSGRVEGVALRRPALLHDHAGDAGCRGGARGPGRAAYQPRRWLVRHPRRARIPAPVPRPRAARRDRRRGPARHGAAGRVLDRQPGRTRCTLRRLLQRPRLRGARAAAARTLAGLAGLIAALGRAAPPADPPKRAADADARHAAGPGSRPAVRTGIELRRCPQRSAKPHGALRRPGCAGAGAGRATRHAHGRGHALLGGLRRGHAAHRAIDGPAGR